MIKQVHERISVSIKGKVFRLVYDADDNELPACHRCALYGEICKASKGFNLLSLCDSIVEEPEAYFVEVPGDIQVNGINNKEITITALRAIRDACKDMGNNARAEVAQKLINQID